MMKFTVRFPFIDRVETANKKTGANKYMLSAHRKKMKPLINGFIVSSMKEQGVLSGEFYGAILSRAWFFKDKRSRDLDNFSSGTKYYTDGLVKCGVIEDDSQAHIILGDTFHFNSREKEELIYIMELLHYPEFELKSSTIKSVFLERNGLV